MFLSGVSLVSFYSEYQQIFNKFRTADHTLHKASGDTFPQYGGKWGKPARQAVKNKNQTSAVSIWWLSI